MWQDDFRTLMISLPFIPAREMIVAHVDVCAQSADYVALESFLSDLIRVYKPLPTLVKALDRIYDQVIQEKTIAKTLVSALDFMNDDGGTNVH